MHNKIAKLIIGLVLTLTALGAIAGAVLFIRWTSHRDTQVMNIEYCFTETGDHYLCN